MVGYTTRTNITSKFTAMPSRVESEDIEDPRINGRRPGVMDKCWMHQPTVREVFCIWRVRLSMTHNGAYCSASKGVLMMLNVAVRLSFWFYGY